MPHVRNKDQGVDAFSAPRDLLRAAQLLAKERRMTKSGFYRYCLAKEVGYSEEESLRIAEHASIGRFQLTAKGNGASTGEKISYSKPKKVRKK